MKNKIKYTDESMGDIKLVKDFLPPSDQLVLKEENIKITAALKNQVLSFLKKKHKRTAHHTSK